MRSTFAGFDIARKALIAQQQALAVTGHNIANAATPGFSRQRAVLSASAPYTIPSMNSPYAAGQVGTGVEVTEIYRLRDEYTDFQFRSQNQTLGNWESQWETLDRVEGIFAEPNSAGLRTTIAEFFNSWQDLSRDAASDTSRAVVRQRAAAVADMFRHIRSQLDDVTVDLNEGIRLAVEDINSLADQISELNGQIQSSELHGYMANDLRDKRDLLVDQLSQLANISVFDRNNQFTIVLNGTSLVRHQTVTHMKLSLAVDANHNHEVVWEDANGGDGLPVRATDGRLAGLTASREKLQGGYIKSLDELAYEFAQEVNKRHQEGLYLPFDPNPDDDVEPVWTQGEALFDVIKAPEAGQPAHTDYSKYIILGAQYTDTPEGRRRLAAASVEVTGDGGNAVRLGQMRNARIEGLNGTVEQRLEGILGALGVDSQQAKRIYENQTILTEQLQARRDAVSSVSLDEELTDMVRFQHAYNAAARLVTTMDEVIDTLINRTGLR